MSSSLKNYSRGPCVGQGQHGQVYQGWRVEDGREVAIKAVRRKNIKAEKMKLLRRRTQPLPSSPAHVRLTDRLGSTEQKILKEIAIMRRCAHPNIVQLLDVIDDKMNEKIYMVMEYMGGGEVRWRDHDDRPLLTVAQTKRIFRDVVLGLEYLHHQGIIHRDIKPANLLWTHDRRAVKITDFGVSHISKPLDGDTDLLDDDDLNKRLGTPPFLAPEVVAEYTTDFTPAVSSDTLSAPQGLSSSQLSHHGRRRVTHAVDIWALGATLFCLLFGHTPFSTNDGEYVLYNIICKGEWQPELTMGCDQVLVPPRPWRCDDTADEGAFAMNLMDGLLQKDVDARITLPAIKKHPWVLSDLHPRSRPCWASTTSPPDSPVSAESPDVPFVYSLKDAQASSSNTGCLTWAQRMVGIFRPKLVIAEMSEKRRSSFDVRAVFFRRSSITSPLKTKSSSPLPWQDDASTTSL